LGLDNKQTASLMSLDLGSKQQTYGVDIRDTAVHWINDIEKVKIFLLFLQPVLRIRIRIRIHTEVSIRIRIRILLSSSKNGKKNFYSCCFVTSF
jgi:hypothetical protein